MSWIGVAASIGGSLISGAMGSKSAGEAAGAQVQSAEEARKILEMNRAEAERLSPFYNTGVAANKRLAFLLGLDSSGGGGAGGAAGGGVESREAIRARLAPQFASAVGRREYDGGVENSVRQLLIKDRNPGLYGGAGVTDEASLNAAVEQELARQQAQAKANAAAQAKAAQDPAYGSLLKKFSASDLAGDVVYNSGLQFGMNEGRDAINARAIAGGGYDSGATLKALTRYANDYGSTKAEGSYNRFMNDKSSTYGMLSGTSGAGQQAGTSMVNAITGANNNIADMITQGGNARAAGIVGQGNAWGSAMSGVSNAAQNYESNQLYNKLINSRMGTSAYGYGGGNYNSFVGNAFGNGFGPAFTQAEIYG